jgi:MoaA/NifB/PqqE/SkfB family radical SAM enzyme
MGPGMLLRGIQLRREGKRLYRLARELRMIGRGLVSTDHPILAHLVVTRRCNLACAYCNEYDHSSQPVPLETLVRRVDHLAGLGTGIVTLSGGEPLMHPLIEGVIRRVRSHRMLAGMITNGYLLTEARIRQLNDAGLDHLQISIDNVKPGPVSKKSLKVLDRKLQLLSEWADFHVNINSVVGTGDSVPADALAIASRAIELGFTSTVGLLHDASGHMMPLSPRERQVFSQIHAMAKKSYSRFNDFQENIAGGKPNNWRCRAGARYMYVCEDGLVHYCSQQRGWPATPLEQYTVRDIRREFLTEKSCAPSCTISCVHQISYLDSWRSPQAPATKAIPHPLGLVQIQTTQQ